MNIKEQILENKFKEYGIKKGWLNESKQAVLDAMEEYFEMKMTDLDKFVSTKLMYKDKPTENPQYKDDGKVEGDIDNSKLIWHDAREELPELNEHCESEEVLCLTRKFGFAQNLKETDTYEVLWWDGKHWQNYDNTYFEDNPDYFEVVYWMYIPK